MLELRGGRIWNTYNHSLKEFCWAPCWHSWFSFRVLVSTVKLLRGINPFGEIWFESGHVTVSSPTFRCILFPVLELQMATDLDRMFCCAILQIINCQLQYTSVSVGLAWYNWRLSSCTAHCLWVSGSSVKPLWPPLHRQTFLENISL